MEIVTPRAPGYPLLACRAGQWLQGTSPQPRRGRRQRPCSCCCWACREGRGELWHPEIWLQGREKNAGEKRETPKLFMCCLQNTSCFRFHQRGTPFPLDAWGSLGAPCCSWALRPMLLVGKCTQKSAGHGALFFPWRPSNNTACCTQACYGAELGAQACAMFTLCSGPVPCPLRRQPCRAPATVCRGGGGMRLVLSIRTICEEVAPKHHKGMERDLKSSLSLG